jgi:hypothetical protein
VEGTWRLPQGELTLSQTFQDLSGALAAGGTSVPVLFGHVRGEQIAFTAGGARYSGRITGATMQGTVSGAGGDESWTATKEGVVSPFTFYVLPFMRVERAAKDFVALGARQ